MVDAVDPEVDALASERVAGRVILGLGGDFLESLNPALSREDHCSFLL